MVSDAMVELPPYPDIRDPRVMVAVPRARRAAMAALWALAERLSKLLADAREPMIAQIKLAWWRDMAALLATDPSKLPKGEPLLAALQSTWAGTAGLGELVDAAEAMLVAEEPAGRLQAAEEFGRHLFAASACKDPEVGRRWGLLWGAALPLEESEARAMLARASAMPTADGSRHQRALSMLDRWAFMIAKNGGERHWRSEGWLLFRLGLLGR